MQTFRAGSAVVRWALLVTTVGVVTAAVIAIALAAAFTLVDSSL